MDAPPRFTPRDGETERSGGEVSDLALAYQVDGVVTLDFVACEEHEWVERARQGDVEAFDAIMRLYEPRLLRFLTGLVGSVEIAQELCQDTFLAAYQALPRAKGEMRLSAWLHTIALNRARSFHRSRKHRVMVPIGDHDIASPEMDMQEAIAESDIVQRVLSQLASSYSEPLLLQLTSGLSCREIGRVLGCSEGAIKVRLMRARDAFRQLYEKETGEPCRT